METYYIPTSSLNFNNILSTESISPEFFYKNRTFGYRRWTAIKENDINNVILLYKRIFKFDRPVSDEEDHPMFVEIKTDQEFNKITEQDEIYSSSQTIYLDPWNTRILFFNETDKNTTLTLSLGSSETKTVRFYMKQIQVVNINEERHPPVILNNVNLGNRETNSCEAEIEKDYKIDKLKGLLYGYYIGKYLSVPLSTVKKLNINNRIIDIYSAVSQDPDKTLSKNQELSLRDLLLAKNEIILNGFGIEKDINTATDYLSKQNEILISIPIENFTNSFISTEKITFSAPELIISELHKIEEQLNKVRSLPLPETRLSILSLQVKSEFLTTENGIDMNKLYMDWINDIIVKKRYDTEIYKNKNLKLALATDIGNKTKEYLGDLWDNSRERDFINKLRQHINGQEFSVEWDNGLLSSFAAVICKGNDWDSLLNFMQAQEMHDYSLAFSFYGVINGFARLTRDFTNHIIEDKDSKTIAELYKSIYKNLFGKDLTISTNIKFDENFRFYEIDAAKELPSKNDTWKHQYEQLLNNFKKDKSLKKNVVLEIESILTSAESKKDFQKKFQQLTQNTNWQTKAKKPNKKWKDLNNIFFNTTGNSLFNFYDNIKEESVLKDTTLIELCQKYAKSDGAKKQFIEDIKWFIDGYIKPDGPYKGNPKNNYAVIEHLYRYLEGKRNNPRTEDQKRYYPEIEITAFITDLKQKYGF